MWGLRRRSCPGPENSRRFCAGSAGVPREMLSVIQSCNASALNQPRTCSRVATSPTSARTTCGTIATERKHPLGLLSVLTLSQPRSDAIKGYLGWCVGPWPLSPATAAMAPALEWAAFQVVDQGLALTTAPEVDSPPSRLWFMRLRSWSCSGRVRDDSEQPLHGIMAAAWLGCRVAAIGRSSKVVGLRRTTGVPCARPPLTEDAVRNVVQRAVVVPAGC